MCASPKSRWTWAIIYRFRHRNLQKRQDIQAAAQYCPLDRLLVETDAPFLAPVPHRGKTNEPAYVRHTAEFLAQLRGDTLENIARASSENFYRLFDKVTPYTESAAK